MRKTINNQYCVMTRTVVHQYGNISLPDIYIDRLKSDEINDEQ